MNFQFHCNRELLWIVLKWKKDFFSKVDWFVVIEMKKPKVR